MSRILRLQALATDPWHSESGNGMDSNESYTYCSGQSVNC
jgi:hypothetical protein